MILSMFFKLNTERERDSLSPSTTSAKRLPNLVLDILSYILCRDTKRGTTDVLLFISVELPLGFLIIVYNGISHYTSMPTVRAAPLLSQY